jgi:hypothetical protein
MAYRYEISEVSTFASESWREVNAAEMCEAVRFKVLMSLDMKIRRTYYFLDKSVIGKPLLIATLASRATVAIPLGTDERRFPIIDKQRPAFTPQTKSPLRKRAFCLWIQS